MLKAKQRQRDLTAHHRHRVQDGSPVLTGTPDSSSDDSIIHRNGSPRLLSRRLSPEFAGSGEAAGHSGVGDGSEKLPLPESRRGAGLLPPIDPQKPSRKHATPRKRDNRPRHLPPSKETSDSHRGSAELKKEDSLDAEVQEYINTYRDSPVPGGSDSQRSSSDSESRGSDVDQARDSGDQLGASMFSRHAPRPDSRLRPSLGSPNSSKGGSSHDTVSSPCGVQEGSLALGPNARELYTTQTHVVEEGKRRRKKKIRVEIVPISPNSASNSSPSFSQTPATPANTQPPDQQSNTRTSTQSKVCTIL